MNHQTSASAAQPEALFFDAVGTLIYLACPVGEHYRQVLRRFGLDVAAQVLEQAFRAAWKVSPARAVRNGPRPDDDKAWWGDLVARVLQAALSPAQHKDFDGAGYFEAVYTHFQADGVWSAYPEVPAVLRTLCAGGYRLGVISNFDRRLYPVLDGLGLSKFFEAVVISSEVGADKPDPAIFRAALARMGLAAGQAWHVGDDPVCDGGAEQVGMRVFRLERPRQALRDVLSALAARETA